MALVFPTNPTNGEVYQDYIFNTATNAWNRISPAVDIQDQIDTIDAKFPVSLTSNVGGTLPVVNGGTGATTVTAAQDNLRVGLVPIDVPTVVATGGTAAETGLGQITFTNCTDIRLQGVFTSAFTHYRIYFYLTGSSASAGAWLRTVRGTTPFDNANYDVMGVYYDSIGNTANSSAQGITRIIVGDYFGPGARMSSVIDVMHPQVSTRTTAFHLTTAGYRSDGGPRSHFIVGVNSNIATDDGIMFLALSGNFSGTIQVFGLNM